MSIISDESSFTQIFKGRTDPLISFRVRVSQFIKISGANQLLGAYIMNFTPTSNGVNFTLQNPGNPTLMSFLIKNNFSFSLDENKNWNNRKTCDGFISSIK